MRKSHLDWAKMKKQNIKKDILVVGVGNILLGDEGVGVHVIRELKKLELPENVEVLDMGVATFSLPSYLGERKKIILVDAVEGGGEVGEIYRILPEEIKKREQGFLSLHEMSIASTLDTLQLEGIPRKIVILGVEVGEIKWGMELSSRLKEKLPQIAAPVLKEISSSEKD